MNFHARLRQEPIGFQMTPMIDVVFLLLCFFLTSQIYAQWEREIEIKLPTAQTAQPPQRLPGEVILNLRSDGAVMVNGQVFDEPKLDQMLTRLAQLSPGQPVLIRADKKTAYEHVIRVLDQCRRADIWNISFATAMPDRAP